MNSLFKSLIPPGHFAIASKIDGHLRHKWFTDPQEAWDFAKSQNSKDNDVYLSIAVYDQPGARAAEHISGNKFFVFDLDYKDYEDVDACTQAAKRLFAECFGSKHAVVFSGGGVHIYTVLTEPISRDLWAGIARAMVNKAIELGIKIDAQVTTNGNGILRVPGSVNFKRGEVSKIIKPGGLLTIDEVIVKFPPVDCKVKDSLTNSSLASVDPITLNIAGVKQASFQLILDRAISGNGCAQIKQAYEEQDFVSEPLWFDLLGLAGACSDRETAIHTISSKYTDYSYDETVKKAEHRDHPASCQSLRDKNPAGCEGCKYKIASPILFGYPSAPSPEDPLEHLKKSASDSPEEIEWKTKYRFPYSRRPQGGVRIQSTDEDGNTEFVDVCNNDLYPIRMINDPDRGTVAAYNLHVYNEVRTVKIVLAEQGKPSEQLATLGKSGLVIGPNQNRLVMQYIADSLRDFQTRVLKEEDAICQFGWDKDNTSFTIGSKVIYEDHVEEAVAAMGIQHIADFMGSKGSLADWVSIANMFNGERFAPHAFVLFSGFGIPLLKISDMAGVNGYTVSLQSKESGTGKSSALHLVNSIYGHPIDLLMQKNDTVNARMHRIGKLCNIPACLDEATTLTPADKKDLLYSVTNSRDKNRMRSSSNEERVNTTTWNTGLFVSTNDSFLNDLGSTGEIYDGPAKRILEFNCYPIRSQDPGGDKRKFNMIKYNYGLAGEVFIKALLANRVHFLDVLLQEEVRVEQDLALASDDRYWIAAAAIGLAGGRLAQELGLHNIDIEPVRKVVYDIIVRQKNHLANVIAETNAGVVSEFIMTNIDKIVREKEDGSVDINSIPKQAMLGRVCQKDGTLEASRAAFKHFCTLKKLSADDVIERLTKDGSLLYDDKKPSFARGVPGPYEKVRTRAYIFKIDAEGIERTISNTLVAS